MPADENTIVLPGGSLGAWLIAGCGLFATLIAMGLVFVPPTGTENVLNYEVNLIGQAAVLIGIGMGVLLHRSRKLPDGSRRRASPDRRAPRTR